jgi:hypothetical protein
MAQRAAKPRAGEPKMMLEDLQQRYEELQRRIALVRSYL